MRKISIFLLVALLVVSFLPFCYAASNTKSVNIPISAKVPDHTPTMSLEIREVKDLNQDPGTGTKVADGRMDFGELTYNNDHDGSWYSKKLYCVLLTTSAFGHKYEIRSTCAGFSYGGKTLPKGSFVLTPDYSVKDNGGREQPSGSRVGEMAIAAQNNYKVYQSEKAGSDRTIRAYYSIPYADGKTICSGYAPIPKNQAPGTYSGTVTLTIAAI